MASNPPIAKCPPQLTATAPASTSAKRPVSSVHFHPSQRVPDTPPSRPPLRPRASPRAPSPEISLNFVPEDKRAMGNNNSDVSLPNPCPLPIFPSLPASTTVYLLLRGKYCFLDKYLAHSSGPPARPRLCPLAAFCRHDLGCGRSIAGDQGMTGMKLISLFSC